MKKVPRSRLLAGTVILVLCTSTILSAQTPDHRPRVVVLPFENLTARAQNEGIARTLTETTILALSLLGSYEVVDSGGFTSADVTDLDLAGMDAFVAAFPADNLLFGTVATDGDGTLQFFLAVYDRAEQRVTVEAMSRAPTIFDVFDAADDLVADAISGFSGIRIAFGTLRVEPDADEEYLLYLDDSLIGQNVASVDRVLTGERTLEIRQVRGDREMTVHRETIEIGDGAMVTVRFTFPAATDEELAREEELRVALERELRIGSDPPGAGAMIEELDELYHRLEPAFPGGIDLVPFYRDRLYLATEMQDLVLLDLKPYAERAVAPGGAGIVDLRSHRDPWNEVYLRYREEEQHWLDQHVAGVPPDDAGNWYQFTPRQRRESIQDDLRRNLSVLAALITLERAAVTDRSEAELVVGYNNLLNAVQSLMEVPVRAEYTWTTETQRAREAMRSYRRAGERSRPVWHWLVGGLGMGLLGYAGYVQVGGVVDDLDGDINDLIDRYESETEYDAIVRARSELDDTIDERNWYIRSQLVAAGVGAALVGTAITARLVSRTRPERIWNRYRNHPFPDRWTAAGLDYRDRSLDRTGPPSLLVLGQDEVFSINGEILTTPQMLRDSLGSWEIDHRSAPADQDSIYRIEPEAGVRILYLGLSE